jgi:hypothetical protein
MKSCVHACIPTHVSTHIHTYITHTKMWSHTTAHTHTNVIIYLCVLSGLKIAEQPQTLKVIYMYIYIYIYIYIYMYVCMCVCMCVCVYIYMYICVYICMYVCMYMYIYTYSDTQKILQENRLKTAQMIQNAHLIVTKWSPQSRRSDHHNQQKHSFLHTHSSSTQNPDKNRRSYVHYIHPVEYPNLSKVSGVEQVRSRYNVAAEACLRLANQPHSR